MPTRRTRIAGAALLVVMMAVTGGGACEPRYDGPLPPPTALGAPPLPAGTSAGVDAIYASTGPITGRHPDCVEFVRFDEAGEARWRVKCFVDDVDEYARAEGTWAPEDRVSVGDYGRLDGRIWMRVVSFNAVMGELSLNVFEGHYCGDRLFLAREGASTADAVEYRLVSGNSPSDIPACS